MRTKKVDLIPTMENKIQRKKFASSIIKNALTIGQKTLVWVPVELMNIKSYQRSRQAHVNLIAENWEDSKCNVLLVSYDEENGCFNVMDGQHRAAAARMRGVEYLVCEIFKDMTLSKEAALFVSQNEHTKKLTAFDTFKANQFINGEQETELSKTDKRIAEVCKNYNIIVTGGNAAHTLKSVPVARDIMKRDGEAGLEFVFQVIADSGWDEFNNGYASDLMEVLGKIYNLNKKDLKEIKRRLCGFLVNSTPEELSAITNNTYPNLKRRGRLTATLADVIKEPETRKGSVPSNIKILQA